MTIPLNDLSSAVRGRLPGLMRAAIAEALRADQPFGCAVADAETGALLGVSPNSGASDPTGHAEVNALRWIADRRLDPGSVVLISTAEPCPMCASACWWASVSGVVYGTSIADLIRFGWRQLDLPCEKLLTFARPQGRLFLLGGYLTDETNPLYRQGPKTKAIGD